MGTIRNQVVIVQSFSKEAIERLHQNAIETFQKVLTDLNKQYLDYDFNAEQMITPVLTSYINEEYTFFINGDCSKLGWPESNKFKEVRMNWIDNHRKDVPYIILVDLGEDYPAKILFDSSLEIRDEE